MMKCYLSSILLLITLSATAQYRVDLGFHTGASNYLGEMGGLQHTRRDFIKDMKMSETYFAGGMFVRYKAHPYVALQGNLSYMRISGDDRLSTNPGRAGRNLNFRNDIVELGVNAQFRLVQFNDVGRTFRHRNDFRAYVFTGIAAFYHNPKAFYSGTWINLRPLRTEGQSKPYTSISTAIPMGIGFYYTYKRKYRIGWELGWRKTFTDYLDDVSTTYAAPEQLGNPLAAELANRTDEFSEDPSVNANYRPGSKRGDPSHNDSYVFSAVTFSYVIKGRPAFNKPRYIENYEPRKHNRRKVRVKF
jgi:hypothetical protein